MSLPVTHEQTTLREAERILIEAERGLGTKSRLVVLEGTASLVGGWPLESFRSRFGPPEISDDDAAPFAEALASCLHHGLVPAPLAIAALGRSAQSREYQRTQGAFYTDFRLARFVGDKIADTLTDRARIVDLAAGSGILLVAAVLASAGKDRSRATELVADSVCAADLDPDALRACRASLASVCDDVEAIARAAGRLRQQDSLMVGRDGWRDIAPTGFDIVIGNPPWEKLKVSRHEYLQSRGHRRHYGDDYGTASIDHRELDGERARMSSYVVAVEAMYPSARGGELDLYKAFCACTLAMLRPSGACCLLLPAGLIRSQGTESLRNHIFDSCGFVRFTVIENRARFFAIDTRFKFLVLEAKKAGDSVSTEVELQHARGDVQQVLHTSPVVINREALRKMRPDLSMPEVRTDDEWRLVAAMYERGLRLDESASPFRATIAREVDMTRDRQHFSAGRCDGDLPLAEGRMVAQHRFGAKAYRSGTGRRALWARVPSGESRVQPQFFYPVAALPKGVARRVHSPRVGFCDVTGQTNERSIICARVPAEVVCGNKVPTITFEDDSDWHLSWLFIAIANSLPFDWIARRVLTTTVNYFVLRSLPLPPIEPRGLVANRIAWLACELARIDTLGHPLGPGDLWRMGELRAEIDARVLAAWGLVPDDLALMLRDFPLLDRGQPALSGESRSTLTKDLVSVWAERVIDKSAEVAVRRVSLAANIGAAAYIASEYAEEDEDGGSAPIVDLLAGNLAG